MAKSFPEGFIYKLFEAAVEPPAPPLPIKEEVADKDEGFIHPSQVKGAAFILAVVICPDVLLTPPSTLPAPADKLVFVPFLAFEVESFNPRDVPSGKCHTPL